MADNFIDGIKAAPVTHAHLEELAIAIDRDVQSGQLINDGFGPMWIIVRTFKDTGMDHVTMLAIMYRMQALADLVESGHLRQWQLGERREGAHVLMNTSVLAAAAQARLILPRRGKAKPRFDMDEFKGLVLSLAEPNGEA